jgi:hypothetical protein
MPHGIVECWNVLFSKLLFYSIYDEQPEPGVDVYTFKGLKIVDLLVFVHILLKLANKIKGDPNAKSRQGYICKCGVYRDA